MHNNKRTGITSAKLKEDNDQGQEIGMEEHYSVAVAPFTSRWGRCYETMRILLYAVAEGVG